MPLHWFEKVVRGTSRNLYKAGEQLGLFPSPSPVRATPSRKKHTVLPSSEAPSVDTQQRHKKHARTSRRIKSDPQLARIWESLINEYFPEETQLREYRVVWSKRRQLRTLASCNIDSLRVRVAQELNHPKHLHWLSPLLYHEMCHAVLGDSIRQKGERTRWHGPEFRALEKRHPQIASFDQWIHSGGWSSAVRSHRAREAHAKRKAQ